MSSGEGAGRGAGRRNPPRAGGLGRRRLDQSERFIGSLDRVIQVEAQHRHLPDRHGGSHHGLDAPLRDSRPRRVVIAPRLAHDAHVHIGVARSSLTRTRVTLASGEIRGSDSRETMASPMILRTIVAIRSGLYRIWSSLYDCRPQSSWAITFALPWNGRTCSSPAVPGSHHNHRARLNPCSYRRPP